MALSLHRAGALPALLLAFSLLLSPTACDSGAAPNDCPETCLCTANGCPENVCGFRLELGENCQDVDPRVELYVAGCLEEQDLTVGEQKVACGTLLSETSGRLVARGERIQWGPVSYECPAGGGLLIPVTLSCESP